MDIGINHPLAKEGVINKPTELEAVASETHAKSAVVVENSSNQSGISELGKLTQKMDSISAEADSLLMKPLSSEQKKAIETLYDQIDKGEKREEVAFQEIDKIFERGFQKLSSEDKEKVEELFQQLETLDKQFEQSANSLELNNAGASHSNEVDIEPTYGEIRKSKKNFNSLSVSELNKLSVAELNKLPPHLVKKLNNQQLMKLNDSQLKHLSEQQLATLPNHLNNP